MTIRFCNKCHAASDKVFSKKCPHCGGDLSEIETKKFSPSDIPFLEKKKLCEACAEEISLTDQFCRHCGRPQVNKTRDIHDPEMSPPKIMCSRKEAPQSYIPLPTDKMIVEDLASKGEVRPKKGDSNISQDDTKIPNIVILGVMGFVSALLLLAHGTISLPPSGTPVFKSNSRQESNLDSIRNRLVLLAANLQSRNLPVAIRYGEEVLALNPSGADKVNAQTLLGMAYALNCDEEHAIAVSRELLKSGEEGKAKIVLENLYTAKQLRSRGIFNY